MNPSLAILDLFSGIGGFSYAAERLVGGFQTIAFCETDRACQRVLAKHWPSTPIFPDVCTLTAADIQPLCPNGLSLITAGFPCQDLSVAGKQAGYDGERSVLFYEIIRLARELRPQFLLLENVRNLLSHQNGETFQETLFQIAKAGYDAEWAVIPASDVGACHRRERIWIIAHASGSGASSDQSWLWGLTEGSSVQKHWHSDLQVSTTSHANNARQYLSSKRSANGHGQTVEQERLKSFAESARHDHSVAANADSLRLFGQDLPLPAVRGSDQGGEIELEAGSGVRAQRGPHWTAGNQSLSPDWRSYVSEPVLRRGDDGLSNRVDRLKQLGNSIVPQVAAIPLQRIKELTAPAPKHNSSL